MALSDLTAYLDDDSLEVPGVRSPAHPEGWTYCIPSPDHKTGLRLTALVNLGIQAAAGEAAEPDEKQRAVLSDEEEREFLPQVLGTAYDEMVADGVSWVRMQRISRYALLYFTLGEDAAGQMVKASAEGNGAAPNRAARRTRGSEAATSSTAVSTVGTSSRTQPKRKKS